MKRRVAERREWNPPPQPFTGPGEKRPQQFQDEGEADAFSRWLAHVEAGGSEANHASPFPAK